MPWFKVDDKLHSHTKAARVDAVDAPSPDQPDLFEESAS